MTGFYMKCNTGLKLVKQKEKIDATKMELSEPSYAAIKDHLNCTDSYSFWKKLMDFMKPTKDSTYRIRDPPEYNVLINFESVSVI